MDSIVSIVLIFLSELKKKKILNNLFDLKILTSAYESGHH